ncbi:cbb3-type cytochrome c oxidase subunit I [Edaphobacter aggregans]|uniref:cbb3-type cytochrome c oxidase subunit I n=1 Tax=Edaphobacter aggregans TaxID=570835 RepID=UPI0009FF36B2|nr:cbb3-type cytochrome c oxidase subunit I [Edaphobacter aggregans]
MNTASAKGPSADVTVNTRLVAAHTFAAFGGLLVSALFGLLVSIKFNAPEFLSQHAWSTWGRLRYDHTQGILYAWLGNAFIAFMYYAVPYLTRRPFTSERLGWWLFVIWNVMAVLGGWSLVLTGHSQPLEWAEFPLLIAACIELGLGLLIVQFALPFMACGAADLYVAGWYLLGGTTFTFLAYPVGNIVPQMVPGAMGAAFSGLWIHDAVGIFVTPFATAIAYFVIPAVTRKPIYSHFYSMVGFWLLFLVYPLNGIHHYVYSSLPMGAQHASEIASIYQGVDVILVVTNLLLSITAMTDGATLRDVPLRFVWTSVVLYLIVSIQGSIQAVMSFNSFIHFTDWVIAHSHLAMIGFASFAAMGGLSHIWQRMPGVRYSRRMLAWSYWLLVVGLALMFIDLTGAGLVQASLWRQHLPWIESVRASEPYWAFRTVSGMVLLAGFGAFAASFFVGPRNSGSGLKVNVAEVSPHSPGEGRAHLWITTAYATTFGAGIGFFVISFVALAIYPAIRLHAQIARTTPSGARLELTASEKRGAKLYAVDGCAYCHSQQVRFTDADKWRFGTPTQAWETQNEFPQMWGTRRIGPDLAREAEKRTKDWQLVHLYNPQYVVPDSMMPSYPWLFYGDPNAPTRDAVDMVAYLNTLGRPAAQMQPAVKSAVFSQPPSLDDISVADGHEVFLKNCSGCHGINADGRSPGGRALRPVAFDLAGFQFTNAAVWRALEQGVRGSSMPAWRLLPNSEFSAVMRYVQTVGRAGGLAQSDQIATDAVLMGAGRRVFETHCVRCHGEALDGNGPDAAQFLPRPANFHEILPSYEASAHIVREGVPGSGMPAWPLLTPAEIQAVTFYMRSFYAGRPAKEQPAAPAAVSGMDMGGLK